MRLSREVSRSKNVFAYMIGHASQGELAFLNGKQPSKDRVEDQWTKWHSQLKAIGRSISTVTMAALLDEELKYFGEKSNKSKAGAKVTATVSAVDKRITNLKAAKVEESNKNHKHVMVQTTALPYFSLQYPVSSSSDQLYESRSAAMSSCSSGSSSSSSSSSGSGSSSGSSSSSEVLASSSTSVTAQFRNSAVQSPPLKKARL